MSDPPVHLELGHEADHDVPAAAVPAGLDSLVAWALGQSGAKGSWEIAIRFVSDPTIRDLHREFMGLDTPTDIMTFPYADDVPTAGTQGTGGDIVISVDTARENAADAGWDLASELRFLVLHGVLHLLGWDDATASQRDSMLQRQHDLLAAWQRSLAHD